MSNKILVSLSNSWADEFDVNALWVTTVQEFENFKSELYKRDISEYVEIYFGTNEWIDFDSAGSILDNISITPISEEFYNEFVQKIGQTYGLISIPGLLEDYEKIENE